MTGTKVGYLPYGAYALKATYQLNFMFAMAITVALIGISTLSGWIVLSLTPEEPELPPTEQLPVFGVFDPKPPPTIIIEEKPEVGGKPAIPSDATYTIPVPVADELVLDDDQVIATQDELRNIVSSLHSDGPIGDGNLVIIDPVNDRPPPDSFVYCEIEPQMVYRAAPEYPTFARMAGITGVVVIKALVDREGNVAEVLIARSSENSALDEAAVKAGYRNKYSPAIQNGRPISVWVTYKVVFKLD